jgi:predicted RecA/RadA family phage recombinase
MKNGVNEGTVFTWTNGTGSDVTAGTCVVAGQILACAIVDIANGASGSVKTNYAFELPKVDAAVIAQGESLTWDVSAGKFDDNAATPATGDVTGPPAVALEAKGATTSDTIAVRLTGVPGTVT